MDDVGLEGAKFGVAEGVAQNFGGGVGGRARPIGHGRMRLQAPIFFDVPNGHVLLGKGMADMLPTGALFGGGRAAEQGNPPPLAIGVLQSLQGVLVGWFFRF